MRSVVRLFRSRSWTSRRDLGVILLGIWLVFVGLLPLLGFGGGAWSTFINLLAIAAGLALMFQR